MKIENNKKLRNTRNSFIPTSVKGIRAEDSFWEKCEKLAKQEGKTRNELIIIAVCEYFKGKNNE